MNNKTAYPMLLSPVPKEIIWGGNKLKTKYGKKAPFDNIAESWELTVREKEKSVISNGEYAGMTLSDYLGDEPFPLLIKFIDAKDRLSVQVHPDDGEGVCGKTEMWYIIEADEGAQLVYGLKKGAEYTDFEKAVASGNTEDVLNFVNVHPGEVYFIPEGQVHAIGGGILLAEIQQNSDTTYRIYDYHRKDKFGNERELHIKEALKSIKIRSDDEIQALRFALESPDNAVSACDKFTVYKYSIQNTVSFSFDNFCSVICTGGRGTIKHNGADYEFESGNTYFLPVNTGRFEISGKAEILIATV